MLPPEKLSAVRTLLEVMVEPLARSLASAPVEEEEITPEIAAVLERARASLARGEGIPHEEILLEFGLTLCSEVARANRLKVWKTKPISCEPARHPICSLARRPFK